MKESVPSTSLSMVHENNRMVVYTVLEPPLLHISIGNRSMDNLNSYTEENPSL